MQKKRTRNKKKETPRKKSSISAHFVFHTYTRGGRRDENSFFPQSSCSCKENCLGGRGVSRRVQMSARCLCLCMEMCVRSLTHYIFVQFVYWGGLFVSARHETLLSRPDTDGSRPKAPMEATAEQWTRFTGTRPKKWASFPLLPLWGTMTIGNYPNLTLIERSQRGFFLRLHRKLCEKEEASKLLQIQPWKPNEEQFSCRQIFPRLQSCQFGSPLCGFWHAGDLFGTGFLAKAGLWQRWSFSGLF